MLQFVLWFVAGKDQGREFPLPPDLDIVIGRVSDVDLLLLDERVSRKHARISTRAGRIVIEDLNSKNGVFVNGRRVSRQELHKGDEIVIGASTMRVLPIGEAGVKKATSWIRSPPPAPQSQGAATTPLLAGSLEELSLSELLQLFANAGKSGVLVLRSAGGVGRVYLRNGQVFSATVETKPMVGARKAFFRMFQWTSGEFALLPLDAAPPRVSISDSTTSLALEGVRQVDEMRLIEGRLPALRASLRVSDPLPGSLRDLATEEIQLFQLVLQHGAVEPVIDCFPGTDLEAYTCLLALLRRGFVVVG
jgi:pSer/pThr/pTyr-binding forkhead associated (FHA) protein